MTTYTAGIDVGSTYTKAVVLDDAQHIAGRAMQPTGFRLSEIAEQTLAEAAAAAGIGTGDVRYVVATGFGATAEERPDVFPCRRITRFLTIILLIVRARL